MAVWAKLASVEKKEQKAVHITHLGLDASALIGAGWPHVAFELDDVIQTCNMLGVPVIIPSIVLTEVKAVWQRQTVGVVQRCRDSFSELARRTPGLLDPTILTLPDDRKLKDAYAKAVRDVITRWKPTVAPLPNVSLRDAIGRSARHELPFRDTDSGFRDSLVIWSMLDGLEKGAVLGLLAEDNFFASARALEMAKARGITLVVLKVRQEARAVIERMARITALREVFEASARQEDRLLEALTKDKERVEAYVQQNLQVPEYPFGISGHVEAVHSVKLSEISGAHVRLPFETKERPDASAELSVKVGVTISRMTPPTGPRSMAVGETVQEASSIFGLFEKTLTEIDALATLDLRVEWPADEKELPTAEYLGVKFGTPEQHLAERMALVERMRGGAKTGK